MIRYQILSVDPLEDGDQRPLKGTFPLSVVERVLAACYADPTCHRLAVAQPVEIKKRRQAYYVESAGHRWHLVAYDASEAARQAARRGVPVRVWFCRDDWRAGCPPLAEVRRETA